MTFQQIINKISTPPKNLFLGDACGALLSAFSLGVILVKFESSFGMPPKTLYCLSFVACIFAIYDLVCYLRIKENWQPFLKAIAIANLSYCFVSIALVFYHYQELTNLGLIYFLLEIIIIFILVKIELKVVFENRSV